MVSFTGRNPARQGFDLSGIWHVGTAMSVSGQGELVERGRIGLHPDKLRLVIDYKNKDLQDFPTPTVEYQQNTVVIHLPKAAKAPENKSQ